jgi:Stress responsive A/B Barrel Domain
MLRHISCLTWKEGTPPEAVAAVEAGLAELPALIPELRAFSFGPDLGLASGNADFAIVADLDDTDGWRRYQEHPAHQALLVDRIRPILASRTAAQLQFG